MAQFGNRPLPSETAPRRGAVLVVEDRDDVRQGMAQLLELHGFLVADARDAEEAFRQLHADPDGFALILLDLLLPGRLSGRDFRMHQLNDPALAGIPTVVVTVADVDPVDREPLQSDGWLEKPFRCADLLETVRRFVVSEGSALQAEP
jgi:CheY-like chemotaxis protein